MLTLEILRIRLLASYMQARNPMRSFPRLVISNITLPNQVREKDRMAIFKIKIKIEKYDRKKLMYIC